MPSTLSHTRIRPDVSGVVNPVGIPLLRVRAAQVSALFGAEY